MAREQGDIAGIVTVAQHRERLAQQTYRDARIEQMNAVADAMIEHGPLRGPDGLGAFLFAVHGLTRQFHENRKSPEQKKYEALNSRFYSNDHLPFAFEDELQGLGREPACLYYSLLGAQGLTGEDRSVEYRMGGDSLSRIGEIAVPTCVLPFRNRDFGELRDQNVTLLRITRRRHSDTPCESNQDYEKKPVFGKAIAKYAERLGTGAYLEAVQRIYDAEETLKKASRQRKKPVSVTS